MTYTLEELEKINQLFPEVSKTPDKWQEAAEKYSELDKMKFKNTFEQANDISFDQPSNIKDLAANIAVKIGLYLHYKTKQYEEALGYFQEALNLKESSLLGSVKILTYIGDLYETKGEYNESLNYYNTAIKKIPDSNANYDNRLDIVFLHDRLAATYENLYQINSDEAKSENFLTDAIKHIEISLEICKELEQQSSLQEHEKSSSQAQEKKLTVYDKIYNTAAMIYETKGGPQKALDYYEKALEIRKELYGKEHFSIAEIYNNIGLFYHTQALILRKVFDTKNAFYINPAIDTIKFLCKKLDTGPIKAIDIPKRFEEEAKTALKNAAQILEKWGGDIYGNVQYNLGLIHKALGEIDEAKNNFEGAKKTLQELYPDGHISIVKVLNSLALIYKQKGEIDLALKCYKEALAVEKIINKMGDSYITVTLQENVRHLVHDLIDTEDIEKLKVLSQDQEEINRFDCTDSTTLIYATGHNKTKTAKNLLKWRADPFQYNKIGVSAFSKAFEKNNEELAEEYFKILPSFSTFINQYKPNIKGNFSEYIAFNILNDYSPLRSMLEFNETATNECFLRAKDCCEALGQDTDFLSDSE